MTLHSDRYSYLGPAGTFTETAMRQVPEAANAEWHAVTNVVQAIEDVIDGESHAAMIPIENSIEGGVSATQDALAETPGIRILGEYVVPITFNLYVRPGERPAAGVITTHPVSYAQCRKWINANIPKHEFIPAPSNGAAAASLIGSTLADFAIAGPGVLEYYDLEVLAGGVGDNPAAVTRFVLIGRDTVPLPRPTGADKTSLIVELPADRAGVLLELLEQFSVRGINLTRIESRPIGDELGRYRFNIDAEGHARDARLGEALMGLKRFSPRVVFLGSYPRADGERVTTTATHSNGSFESAREWLDGVLGPEG